MSSNPLSVEYARYRGSISAIIDPVKRLLARGAYDRVQTFIEGGEIEAFNEGGEIERETVEGWYAAAEHDWKSSVYDELYKRSYTAVRSVVDACRGVALSHSKATGPAGQAFASAVKGFHVAWNWPEPDRSADTANADDIESILETLESAFGANCRGLWMLRDVLARLGVIDPPKVSDGPSSVRFVTTNDRDERLFRFTAERLDATLSTSERLLVPDAGAFGSAVLDERMLESLRTAFDLVETFPEGSVVRWRIDSTGGLPDELTGTSAGGAFWLALEALARGVALGRVAVVARLYAGSLAGVCPRTLPDKLAKLVGERFGTCVISKEQVTDDLCKEYEPLRMISASSVDDRLLDILSGKVDLAVRLLRGRALPARGVRAFGAFRPHKDDQGILDSLLEPRVIAEDRRREMLQKLGYSGVDTTSEPLHEHDEATLNPGLTDVLRHGPVLLLGEPHEGKTMALWFEVWKCCETLASAIDRGDLGPDDPGVLVPLVLPLGSVEESPAFELDRLALEKTLDIVTPEKAERDAKLEAWLSEKVERGEYRIFLDALDEYRGSANWLEDRIGEEGTFAERVALLTSRPTADYEKYRAGRALWFLASWNDFDVGEAVDRFFEGSPRHRNSAVTIRAHIDRFREPRALVRQPLILAILCDLEWNDPGAELPGTREEILRHALELFFERGELKRQGRNESTERLSDAEHLDLGPKFEVKEWLLRAVAWEHLGRATLPIRRNAVESRIRRRYAELARAAGRHDEFEEWSERSGRTWGEIRKWLEANRADDVIKDLVASDRPDGILVERERDRFRFLLESFHELGAASYLESEYPPLRANRSDAEFKRAVAAPARDWPELAERERWSEDERPLLLKDLENIWMLLAARLDGERRLWLMEAMLDALEDLDDDRTNRILVLLLRIEAEARAGVGTERCPDTKAIRAGLIKKVDLASSRYDHQQMRLIRALGESDSEEAVECLVDTFDSRDFVNVRAAIVDGLARSRLDAAGETLLKALEENSDQDVRALCADGLTGYAVRSETARARIQAVFESDAPWDLRQRCLALLDQCDGAREFLETQRDRAEASRDVDLWRTIEVLVPSGDPPSWISTFTEGFDEYKHGPTGMVFVNLPGAKNVAIGSLPDERDRIWREHHHSVEALSPFAMGRTTLSRGMWKSGLAWAEEYARGALLPENPEPCDLSEDDLPLVGVDWEDARRFCALFGWYLPTEAQWEYACRAGSETRFAFGDELDESQARFAKWNDGPVPVDAFPPNAFGLYNMHGNVWEWCEDVFDERFYWNPMSRRRDPQCLRGSGFRVIRGGSWIFEAGVCRSACRFRLPPWNRVGFLGFRPARPLR